MLKVVDAICMNDKVIWDKTKSESIMELLQKSTYFIEYFDDIKAFKSMFEEILIRDIRSLHQRNNKQGNHKDNTKLFECKICGIILKYTISDTNKTVTIVDGYIDDKNQTL